ncbi:MAG: type I-U CRISPR-associated protein Csx17 [Polyangiaceae bacterium]|nr:type I-U CRISPR-associated protein Csx17 [Polyangiaceae bacterium]
MTLHVHHLTGCSPVPLAHYLKALGILRLVSEQKDPAARGWWQDEHFCLMTELTREALETFFLEEYAPTPFLSPWNKGSGFFAINDPALGPIERSSAERLKQFRLGIADARVPLAELARADHAVRALKDRTKKRSGMSAAEAASARSLRDDSEYKSELAAAEREFKRLKADLFSPCARTWRGAHREWMDAALVLPESGNPAFPSLLGTGGNDGRIDFTNNAMQHIARLFDVNGSGAPNERAHRLLCDALWSEPASGTPSGAIGQFLPGSAGGANSTSGPSGDAFVNPWDFVMMLEGSVLFSARSTRRLDPNATASASAPFAVRAHPVGYGSRGDEKAARGEQWMPVWERPCGLSELRDLLGEARVQLGQQLAYRPVDVARALARLGVARGLRSFLRYGFLERNGQSNLAVPLGRLPVLHRPRARLIDDLAPWLQRLQREARDKSAPARLIHAERRLSDAVFSALTHDDQPSLWQSVLREAAQTETILASGTGYKAGPIPPLSPEWLKAADDGSIEWRLACALGSAAAEYDQRRGPLDPVRHHWLPLGPGARRFSETDRRLAKDVRVVMAGRDPISDLAALVQRRVIESSQRGQRSLPLVAAPGWEASTHDLAELVAGRVRLDIVTVLACALMAVQWRAVRGSSPRTDAFGPAALDEGWVSIRLAALPWPLDGERTVPLDATMLRRLQSGDAIGAAEIALRRLRSAGLRPPIRCAMADAGTARRWAASLAFPINRTTARRLARRFEPETEKEIR